MKQQVGYRALLKGNANFRNLFLARLISLFGDWFNLLAILALLRAMGQHSAGSFGWILILKMLPSVIVAPIAGVIADRFSRRKVMLIADGIRALIVACMFLVLIYPSLTLIYSLVILQSTVSTFFEPARTALLPDVVSKAELTAANALGAAMWSTMLTLGSAIGGVVTALLGWEVALVVDILSYLVSIWFLLRIQEPDWKKPERNDVLDWKSLLGIRDMLEGFRYVFRRPRVFTLMFVKFGWALAGSSTLLLTLMGERVFVIAGLPVISVTILYVSRGMGTGIGPFLGRSLSKSEPAAMERMIFYGYLCGALFYLLLPSIEIFWLSVLCVFIAHLGGAVIWVFSTIRLQQILPTQIRGRVFASENASFTLAIVGSTWLFGWLVDVQKVDVMSLPYVLGGGLSLAAILWLIRGRVYGWAVEESSSAN